MTKNRWIAAGAALVVVLALLALAVVAGDDADPDGRVAAPAVEADDETTATTSPTATTTTTITTTTSTTSTAVAPADPPPSTAAPAAPRPTPASTTTTPTTTVDEPVEGPPGTEAPPPSSIRAECEETTTADAFVRVCVTRAVAGQPVTFTVEARGRLRDDCGSPVPDYGDGTEVAVCAIGCESLPPEPVRFERSYDHTYEEGGRYTARFHFPGCGEDSGTDLLVAPLEVHVEG